jgi:hypothetical protein
MVLAQGLTCMMVMGQGNYLNYLFQFVMGIILDIGLGGWKITLICIV